MFELEAKSEAVKKGLNKVDCMKIKKNFGYMVKQLWSLPKTEWLNAANAILEHHFENHSLCGSWCKRRHMTKQQLEEDCKSTGKYYRCKEKDSAIYLLLKDILSSFILISRLEDIAHGCDTQINESLNGIIAWYAPKNKTFSGSRSLQGRVFLAVGIVLVGYKSFIEQLLCRLGIEATEGTVRHLETIAKRKGAMSEQHKSIDYKRKRQEKNRKTLSEHIAKAEKKRRRTGFYKTGEGFNTCIPVVDSKNACSQCGQLGHKSSRSTKCEMNIANQKKAAEDKLAAIQATINARETELQNNH